MFKRKKIFFISFMSLLAMCPLHSKENKHQPRSAQAKPSLKWANRSILPNIHFGPGPGCSSSTTTRSQHPGKKATATRHR